MHSVRVAIRFCLAPALLFVPLAALAAAAPATGDPAQQFVVNAKEVNWGAAPPNLPKGAKVAVLYGDPAKEGPFVLRLSVPSGYKVAPHWHAQPQDLTVISGALYLGSGETALPKYARLVRPGGFARLPAQSRQYAFTKAATVVEIHGSGPFDMNYVNPEDDPLKWAQDKMYYFPSQYKLNAPDGTGPAAPSF